MPNTRPVIARLRWLPMGVLLPLALASGSFLPPWLWMWTLAIAVFAGFKWTTFSLACQTAAQPIPASRVLIYLLAWPGMDAPNVLFGAPPSRPAVREWFFAALKTGLGAGLFWGVAPLAGGGLLTGWIGMVGTIFLLHFGTFHLVSLFWRTLGVDAQPLMHAPVLSASLSEFWSRRWNSGFRDLVFGLWFAPWKARFGPSGAIFGIFLFSGVIHDLVISVPARGDYGLPTLYFALQGLGLLAEHSRRSPVARWRGRWPGRVWTFLVVVGPVFWLFHPPFVRRVILPFLHAFHAL